jgi:hypothetical protein
MPRTNFLPAAASIHARTKYLCYLAKALLLNTSHLSVYYENPHKRRILKRVATYKSKGTGICLQLRRCRTNWSQAKYCFAVVRFSPLLLGYGITPAFSQGIWMKCKTVRKIKPSHISGQALSAASESGVWLCWWFPFSRLGVTRTESWRS